MIVDPNASFRELLTAAINDLAATGYTSAERIAGWIERLRNAAERELGPDWQIDVDVRQGFTSLFERFVDGVKLPEYVEGIGRFTKAMIKPKLYAELDRRILAAANLIKRNKREAVAQTLRRFEGWSTSIPPGGDDTIDRRETKAMLGKELRDYKYQRRFVNTDQGHKLVANVAALVAEEAGAIAGIWNSHGAHDPSYAARKEHLARDGKIYLIRGSWAQRDGLVKPVHGYVDNIDSPAQLPNCRCWMTYLTSPRKLPDAYLTKRGQDWIAKGHSEMQRRIAS